MTEAVNRPLPLKVPPVAGSTAQVALPPQGITAVNWTVWPGASVAVAGLNVITWFAVFT